MLFRTRFLMFLAITSTSTSLLAQQSVKPDESLLDKHGTCAVTAVAPFGEAFIIDSRVTFTDSVGKPVGHTAGCKALLPRPTILLAGVGLEDTHGRAGHWNSLDEASRLLKDLPENTTSV